MYGKTYIYIYTYMLQYDCETQKIRKFDYNSLLGGESIPIVKMIQISTPSFNVYNLIVSIIAITMLLLLYNWCVRHAISVKLAQPSFKTELMDTIYDKYFIVKSIISLKTCITRP